LFPLAGAANEAWFLSGRNDMPGNDQGNGAGTTIRAVGRNEELTVYGLR